jgi:hypothetical protein
MSQIAATKKSDLITLPRSTSGLVQQINTVPTVINLRAIGDQAFNAASASGEAPGLQDTYCSIVADVTGSVVAVAVTAGGSGYTSAPAVAFTASTLVGSVTITGGGSGYTLPPAVSFSGGGGSGAQAVAVIDPAGQVTGVIVACLGAGYTGAPTVAFTSVNGQGSGAAATAVLATAVATATISAGAVTAITITTTGTQGGAGYGSGGAAAVTFTGGGGSGAAATATIALNAPSLTATGVGNGTPGNAPGICGRIAATLAPERDAFARKNQDSWLGVVASNVSGGVVRIFRASY